MEPTPDYDGLDAQAAWPKSKGTFLERYACSHRYWDSVSQQCQSCGATKQDIVLDCAGDKN